LSAASGKGSRAVCKGISIKEIPMSFTPPFCPNKDCPTQQESAPLPPNWFVRKGFRSTRVVGRVPRFRCQVCGAGFSSRTFDVDYWTHRLVDYRDILNLLVGGSGIRQACRTLGVSTRLLANRHVRLARQALALHSQCMEDFRLAEPLVLDGFESFAFSQYHPNNLHLLVTSSSQFVLGLHGATLRRKGRMTEAQKRRREVLERDYRAPPNAIYKSCKGLLNYGCLLSFGSGQLPIRIATDEKREYAWALERLRPFGEWLEEGLLEHTTISSKAPRTLDNPLFAVNYLDRQLRKDLAEHTRETVRFARRLEHSLERAMIHLGHHNYFKAFRSRCPDQQTTHAQQAGIERERVLRLRDESLSRRAFGWRVDLEAWQQDLWHRKTCVPIHHVTPLPRHLLTA
jgi:transposase-like protein